MERLNIVCDYGQIDKDTWEAVAKFVGGHEVGNGGGKDESSAVAMACAMLMKKRPKKSKQEAVVADRQEMPSEEKYPLLNRLCMATSGETTGELCTPYAVKGTYFSQKTQKVEVIYMVKYKNTARADRTEKSEFLFLQPQQG
jgi:hypothetical protein